MSKEQLIKRLNQVLPRVTSPGFLGGEGIGNEIPFYIFDYPPEHEIAVREYLAVLEAKLANNYSHLNVRHVNLLALIVEYLSQRGYYEKALDTEQKKGTAKAVKAIASVTTAEKLADHIKETLLADSPELVFVSGIGSAYPIVRTHELLNNLHRHTGLTPLVLFYPGVYDKTTLHLFSNKNLGFDSSSGDRKRKAHYYRAFRLID
tara:strand:- start:1415 stop:2029 length:615 start_codon:yes stop_codon:yes gene_type:complete